MDTLSTNVPVSSVFEFRVVMSLLP